MGKWKLGSGSGRRRDGWNNAPNKTSRGTPKIGLPMLVKVAQECMCGPHDTYCFRSKGVETNYGPDSVKGNGHHWEFARELAASQGGKGDRYQILGYGL